jgi:hypothetical protein
MHNYRQVIFRMRSGQSDRSIAQAGIMGRTKCALVRQIAQRQGWLDQVALPAEEELAAVFVRTPALLIFWQAGFEQNRWRVTLRASGVNNALQQGHFLRWILCIGR